ncbi:hypothetical protein K438DRAFT_1254130 [Mycena galopus ATCC 62051]|nr:hypothetical protein K438DRAFT_1254130 [Mycena galopus ATCC 62051]
MAALARRKTIPILMLVAARVKEWVEPLLYRVIMISSSYKSFAQTSPDLPIFTLEILLRVIASKPPRFLQNSVQHLFLDDTTTPQELITICTACNDVVDLFHHDTGSANLPSLDGFYHLRRLALSMDELRLIDSGRSVLDKITHLELLNPQDFSFKDLPAFISLMSRLTHIALNVMPREDRVLIALRECGSICCIIFLIEDCERGNPLLDDPRFVCLHQRIPFREGWLRGADTGNDYWEVADAFLAARREGEVDRTRYKISDIDTDMSWRN